MIDQVGVIGLGLIGGSIVRDLASCGVEVFGWDRDRASLQAAVDEGVVHHALSDDLAGVRDLQVIVLAVPVRAALQLLPRIASVMRTPRLITDTGSTKREVCLEAQALGLGSCFVGGHPLAGDHRSGWIASRAGLFQDARVFLCATPQTEVDAICCARDFWQLLGAKPEVQTAASHDAMLAWTSHLAQFTSSAFGRAVGLAGYARGELGPGGESVARLAASDADLWADIALDNRDQLLPALEQMRAEVDALRSALEQGSRETLRELLLAGRNWAADTPVKRPAATARA